MKTPNYLNLDDNSPIAIELAKGCFIVRKLGAKTVYMVLGYCRINRRYEIQDTSDISKTMLLKKGTIVFIADTSDKE